MLAKSGWWGGNPSEILNAPINEVVNAYYYEIFCREYEMAYIEINKDYQK